MRAITESLLDWVGGLQHPETALHHLEATMEWLCRAQDASGDGGVARMYHLREGWGASYPETTGYIIPTFLHYARMTGRDEFRDRALRMADWECAVQMPEGAVQGGTVDEPPTPAIFNTGQVLFGWLAAWRESQAPQYLESAQRAARWLVAQQDEDGLWRRNLSRYCSASSATYAYNVRSAWALLLYAGISGDEAAQEAGLRNMRAVQAMALPNGWLPSNCLSNPAQPLLHTIAYTLQGLLETGVMADDEAVLETVSAGGMQLRWEFRRRGGLLGRYDHNWRGAASWRCLTGEAQTAIVWYRLAQWSGDSAWRDAADELTCRVCETQRLSGQPEVVGGVKGSYPVYGQYGRYQFLNWAAKFHADALMLKAGFQVAGTEG